MVILIVPSEFDFMFVLYQVFSFIIYRILFGYFFGLIQFLYMPCIVYIVPSLAVGLEAKDPPSFLHLSFPPCLPPPHPSLSFFLSLKSLLKLLHTYLNFLLQNMKVLYASHVNQTVHDLTIQCSLPPIKNIFLVGVILVLSPSVIYLVLQLM